MSKIKDRLVRFIEDMSSIEIGVIEPLIDDKTKLVSYSKIEFEGDMISIIDSQKIKQNKQLMILHQQLLKTSIQNRKSMINLALTALSG